MSALCPQSNARRGLSAASVASPTAAGSFPITRRQLLLGAVGVAGVAALVAGGYGVSEAAESDTSTRLQVSEGAVFTTENCELIEDENGPFTSTAAFSLPYGAQLWSNDGAVAIALVPSETASPLVTAHLLNLTSGNETTVLPRANGADDGFEIFDARACADGLVWIEANICDGRWRVLSAPLGAAGAGDAAVLAEGDNAWEMPTIAACGSYAWWQTLPQLGGDHEREDSVVYRAPFGADADEAQERYRSHGRFATAIAAGVDSVTIAPRSEGAASSYDLVNLDADSGETADKLALPSSMAPADAGYGENGFAFTFDAIYNYGAGLANLGTYTPATAKAAGSGDADAYSNEEWFRFDRAPLAAPASCNDWFIVKSTSAVCAVDLANRRYWAFDVPEGSDTYGSYLASSGVVPTIVTFANVDHTPLDGNAIYECEVRAWKPTASAAASTSSQSEAADHTTSGSTADDSTTDDATSADEAASQQTA